MRPASSGTNPRPEIRWRSDSGRYQTSPTTDYSCRQRPSRGDEANKNRGRDQQSDSRLGWSGTSSDSEPKPEISPVDWERQGEVGCGVLPAAIEEGFSG